jgi:hypothetical protein
LARVFPSYDRNMYDTKMADRALAWLDQCAYQIVSKDQVTLAPPGPAAVHRRRPQSFIKRPSEIQTVVVLFSRRRHYQGT